MVEAVAAANPNTIVVLETGNPIAMPWRDKVKAVLAAWYPGQEGAQAIAEVLTGKVNPSGRLPITVPTAVEPLPRPTIPSFGTPENTPVTVAMNEGADVGYRWFAARGPTPMYPFGHGMSYTGFAYSGLSVKVTPSRRQRGAAPVCSPARLLHPTARSLPSERRQSPQAR